MAWLLRIIVGLLLILSALALFFGNMLYSKREEIKGQTQRLQRGVIEVADTIENETTSITNYTEKNLPRVSINVEQLKQYYQLDPITRKPVLTADGRPIDSGTNTLDAVLKDLRGKAMVQYTRLNDTRDMLKSTQEKLAETVQKLLETEQKLAEALQKIKELEEKIAKLEQEKQALEEEKQTLTEERNALKEKLDDRDKQIAKLQDNKLELESKINAYKRQIDKVEKELNNCRRGDAEGQNIPAGYQGAVIVVNNNFNFVVIDLPAKSMLVPNVNLTIQRKDQLVGKIRVTEVKPEERFAIADILTEWQQLPIKEGDTAFY